MANYRVEKTEMPRFYEIHPKTNRSFLPSDERRAPEAHGVQNSFAKEIGFCVYMKPGKAECPKLIHPEERFF